MNIIVVRARRHCPVVEMRGTFHIKEQPLHILRLIMTTQPSSIPALWFSLSLMLLLFLRPNVALQPERPSLFFFFPSQAVPVVGGHTALHWPPSQLYLWCVITLPSPLPATGNQFSLPPCSRRHTQPCPVIGSTHVEHPKFGSLTAHTDSSPQKKQKSWGTSEWV